MFFIIAALGCNAAIAKEIAPIVGIDTCTALPDLNKAVEDANGYRALFEEQGYLVTYLENPCAAACRIFWCQQMRQIYAMPALLWN